MPPARRNDPRLCRKGAATVIDERDLSASMFKDAIERLLNDAAALRPYGGSRHKK